MTAVYTGKSLLTRNYVNIFNKYNSSTTYDQEKRLHTKNNVFILHVAMTHSLPLKNMEFKRISPK